MSDESSIIHPSGVPGPAPHKPRQEKVSHFLIMGAATVVILAGVQAARGIIGPMLLALFLTIVLLIPLRWLRQKGCSNILSLVIVLVCTVAIFAGISYFVGRSLNDFFVRLPAYRARIIQKVEQLDNKLEQFGFVVGDFAKNKLAFQDADDAPPTQEPDATAPKLPEPVVTLPAPVAEEKNEKEADEETAGLSEEPEITGDGSVLPDEIQNILKKRDHDPPPLIALDAESVTYWVTKSLVEIRHLAEGGLLVLIFTVFMLLEASRFPEKVDRAFGKEAPINNEHFHRIASDIRRYLWLKALSSLMSASAATLVYWVFGVPATLFWGIVAFFLYFIPNVGGTIAAIVPGLLIFMTYDVEGVLLYGVCLVTIECSIGYGIEPKMLGHGLGISTVVIILSLFSWGWILGPIGLFLAAPLTIMVKIILQAFKETEWIAILLDDKAHGPSVQTTGAPMK